MRNNPRVRVRPRVRLHRYEPQVRRAWHTALRELRVHQKAAAAGPIRPPSVAEAMANF